MRVQRITPLQMVLSVLSSSGVISRIMIVRNTAMPVSDAPVSLPDGLWLGSDHTAMPPTPVALQLPSLLRHMVALGSSGSGKTVLCKVVVEEMLRHGVPAICIDPHGTHSCLTVGLRFGQ